METGEGRDKKVVLFEKTHREFYRGLDQSCIERTLGRISGRDCGRDAVKERSETWKRVERDRSYEREGGGGVRGDSLRRRRFKVNLQWRISREWSREFVHFDFG